VRPKTLPHLARQIGSDPRSAVFTSSRPQCEDIARDATAETLPDPPIVPPRCQPPESRMTLARRSHDCGHTSASGPRGSLRAHLSVWPFLPGGWPVGRSSSSRRIMGFAVFPASALLGFCEKFWGGLFGPSTQHLVSDQGSQFTPRSSSAGVPVAVSGRGLGAIGKLWQPRRDRRCIRTISTNAPRLITVPYRLAACSRNWRSMLLVQRPPAHTRLGAATPDEVYHIGGWQPRAPSTPPRVAASFPIASPRRSFEAAA